MRKHFILPELQGLRFPDEFVIKFFYKEGLDQNPGQVLELGCGNGNNLLLFYQYGWNTLGIDYNEKSIEHGNFNFQQYRHINACFAFKKFDLNNGIPEINKQFDVILMPSVFYYISRKAMIKCLNDACKLLKDNGAFFLRMRAVGDYRYRRGQLVEKNGFRLNISETGEKDLLNVFYHKFELVDMLQNYFKLASNSLKIFRVKFDNWQNNLLIPGNNDIVIWGRK
jgi:SAM-dependent methyltransferase